MYQQWRRSGKRKTQKTDKTQFPTPKKWFIYEFHPPPPLKANVILCRCFFFPLISPGFGRNSSCVFLTFRKTLFMSAKFKRKLLPNTRNTRGNCSRLVCFYEACVTMAPNGRFKYTETRMRTECTQTHVRRCQRNTMVGS
jgi:hypothetical protein